jgi:hypothetical protein
MIHYIPSIKTISVKGKHDEWSLHDESAYELFDREITEAMLHAERMCAFWKQHARPWTEKIRKATHTIRYWDARLMRKGVRYIDHVILNYYLAHLDVKVE